MASLLIILNSCIYEIKDEAGSPIDTNYLHGFTKVDLSFTAATQYMMNSGEKDTTSRITILFNNYMSGIQSATSWNGNTIQISGNTHSNYQGFDQNHQQTSETSQASGFMLSCNISRAGNQIDSGFFSQYYSQNSNSLISHSYIIDNTGIVIHFQYLDQTLISPDSIIFSIYGNSTGSKVTQVHDSTNFIFSSYLPPPGARGEGHILKNVLWGVRPFPILRVKLYK
jgi:hypothetical protein